MAQYKVPQDVEADDKLLGPFTFRQFIYLLISAGLGFLAYGLAQIFPLLAIIPIPFILFLLLLALPIKKDQPMETYLAALISFYTKSRKRFWNPGQRESTILITAPKKVEENRVRDISGNEASHRLSFLANIVDSEGRSIKNFSDSPMREDFVAEANATNDIFENTNTHLDNMMQNEAENRRKQLVTQMRASFEKDRIEAIKAATPHTGNVVERPAEKKAPANPTPTSTSTTPTPTPTPPTPKQSSPKPEKEAPTLPTPKPTKPKDNSVYISLR